VFRALGGQLALQETVGQVDVPLVWMVTPKLLPLPLDRFEFRRPVRLLGVRADLAWTWPWRRRLPSSGTLGSHAQAVEPLACAVSPVVDIQV
jgi:hypothetical protein